MEERLFKVLSLVNDWLKFAESKNALIIAFQSALAVGVFRASMDARLDKYAFAFAWSGLVCLGLGSIIALLSFFPRTNLTWLENVIKSKDAGRSKNLVFFGHIADLDVGTFISELAKSSGDQTNYAVDSVQWHLAEQVVANSKVASRKYQMFSWALTVTVAAVTLLTAAALARLLDSSK